MAVVAGLERAKVGMELRIQELVAKLLLTETKLLEEKAVTKTLEQEMTRMLQRQTSDYSIDPINFDMEDSPDVQIQKRAPTARTLRMPPPSHGDAGRGGTMITTVPGSGESAADGEGPLSKEEILRQMNRMGAQLHEFKE